LTPKKWQLLFPMEHPCPELRPQPKPKSKEIPKACQKCYDCTKPVCNHCKACLRNQFFSEKTELCYQKMCYKIPVNEKAKKASTFPPGWTFCFNDVDPNNRNRKRSRYGVDFRGLCIIAPNKKSFYRSVEAAANRNLQLLGLVNMNEFYLHVGLVDIVYTKHDQRKYSKSKRIGEHVYAKFEDNFWYWGHVVASKRKRGNGVKNRKVIEYEDGIKYETDDNNICTEMQYKLIFDREPSPVMKPKMTLEIEKSKNVDIKLKNQEKDSKVVSQGKDSKVVARGATKEIEYDLFEFEKHLCVKDEDETSETQNSIILNEQRQRHELESAAMPVAKLRSDDFKINQQQVKPKSSPVVSDHIYSYYTSAGQRYYLKHPRKLLGVQFISESIGFNFSRSSD